MKTPAVILLADDNRDDVLLLRHAFELAGSNHQIIDVDDGRRVIEYLLGEQQYADRRRYPMPALLLLDLHMANMSGFDVLAWLRDHADFKEIRVVVFCTSLFETDRNRAHELGASEYVEKCGDFRQLSRLVALLSERYLERPLEAGQMSEA